MTPLRHKNHISTKVIGKKSLFNFINKYPPTSTKQTEVKTMISSIASNALRSASRRGSVASIQRGSSSVRFATNTMRSSSHSSNLSKTMIVEGNNSSRNNKAAVLATSIGLIAASFATLQQNQQHNRSQTTKCETNSTQNFWGQSAATAVKETEEKFGTYWPRNILILL